MNTWEIKFTTGHSKDPRYYRAEVDSYGEACDEVFNMYCGVNTTIVDGRIVDLQELRTERLQREYGSEDWIEPN